MTAAIVDEVPPPHLNRAEDVTPSSSSESDNRTSEEVRAMSGQTHNRAALRRIRPTRQHHGTGGVQLLLREGKEYNGETEAGRAETLILWFPQD